MTEAHQRPGREDALRELVEIRVLDAEELQAELAHQEPEPERQLPGRSRVPAVLRAIALILR